MGRKEVTVESPHARVVRDFMQHYTDLASFDRYLAPNIEYISLPTGRTRNCDESCLGPVHTRGSRHSESAQKKLPPSWDILSFDFERVMAEGDDVVAFGRFAYETKILKRRMHPPFAIWAKVRDGKIHFFQFLELDFGHSGIDLLQTR